MQSFQAKNASSKNDFLGFTIRGEHTRQPMKYGASAHPQLHSRDAKYKLLTGRLAFPSSHEVGGFSVCQPAPWHRVPVPFVSSLNITRNRNLIKSASKAILKPPTKRKPQLPSDSGKLFGELFLSVVHLWWEPKQNENGCHRSGETTSPPEARESSRS